MMTLGAQLSVLNDFEEVAIRYKGESIFVGQVMDIARKLSLDYWFYDVKLVMALNRKLFIEIEK